MELIVITPEEPITDEIEIVNQLLAIGLQRLHVRKPQFTITEYRHYINAIDPEYHSHIVLHGCFELYKELGLSGIHLNTAARNDTAEWPQINDLPPSAISTSFHSWQEVVDNEFPYSYVFISPVFDSISKTGYKAGISLNGVVATKQKLAANNKYCPQIIGLGGVGPAQVTALYQYGFDGAAMLGAIWLNDDPVGQLKRAMDALKYLLAG